MYDTLGVDVDSPVKGYFSSVHDLRYGGELGLEKAGKWDMCALKVLPGANRHQRQ